MDSKIFYFFCFLFLKGKHIGVTKEGTNFVLLHIKNRLQIWKVLSNFHIVVYCKIILPESLIFTKHFFWNEIASFLLLLNILQKQNWQFTE